MTRYLDRRRFLQGLTAGVAAFTTPGAFAEQLAGTGTMTEGPFYPDKLPLDTDNDLMIINDSTTPAVGEVMHLAGRVLTPPASRRRGGRRDLAVRRHRVVHRPRAERRPGATRTSRATAGSRPTRRGGTASARSSRSPTPCIGIFRTAHIHVAVSQNGRRVFTSQLLVNGHPANARDGVVRGLDARALKTLLVDFQPLPGSKLGELSANFDIVLGATANELEPGPLRGVPPSNRSRRRGA